MNASVCRRLHQVPHNLKKVAELYGRMGGRQAYQMATFNKFISVDTYTVANGACPPPLVVDHLLEIILPLSFPLMHDLCMNRPIRLSTRIQHD